MYKVVKMVAPGEETRSSTVVLPSPALRLLSGGNGTSNRSLFRQDVKQDTGKVDHVDIMLVLFKGRTRLKCFLYV